MRTVALLAGLLGLTACQQEPDFDERYAEANRTLEEKAAAIERDLANPQTTAAQAAADQRPGAGKGAD